MKILKSNAGPLTNFEVLDFLRSRGAGKDPTRVIAPIAPSEFKVFDYLEQSASCNQTRESINNFVMKCKNYKLSKAEILNIINIRPSSIVEIYTIIEECEKRIVDNDAEEFVDMVVETLPPSPSQMESNEGDGEENEEQPEAS